LDHDPTRRHGRADKSRAPLASMEVRTFRLS
jgi:hypothetical protein